MTTIGDRRYVAVLLPLDPSFKLDERAYRRYVRYFADDARFAREGSLCINPEAGEIFYLTRAEKRRVVEIATEEAHGKCRYLGDHHRRKRGDRPGLQGARCQRHLCNPAVRLAGRHVVLGRGWVLDQIIAQDRAVDLPIVTHPVGGAKLPFYPGLPLAAIMRICGEVPNVVGWKMIYTCDISKGLRSLDRPVAIMGALASRFYEYRATGLTLSGLWTFAKEPMLDHLNAWDRRDLDAACAIWNGGLSELHDYVADVGRLHIRYKARAGCAPDPQSVNCAPRCHGQSRRRSTWSIGC